MRQFLMAALLLLPLAPVAQPQTEPTVRIGLTQNASTVTVRSAMAFTVEQHSTRAATFTTSSALTGRPTGSSNTFDCQPYLPLLHLRKYNTDRERNLNPCLRRPETAGLLIDPKNDDGAGVLIGGDEELPRRIDREAARGFTLRRDAIDGRQRPACRIDAENRNAVVAAIRRIHKL
jgi:hypothetical protein